MWRAASRVVAPEVLTARVWNASASISRSVAARGLVEAAHVFAVGGNGEADAEVGAAREHAKFFEIAHDERAAGLDHKDARRMGDNGIEQARHEGFFGFGRLI